MAETPGPSELVAAFLAQHGHGRTENARLQHEHYQTALSLAQTAVDKTTELIPDKGSVVHLNAGSGSKRRGAVRTPFYRSEAGVWVAAQRSFRTDEDFSAETSMQDLARVAGYAVKAHQLVLKIATGAGESEDAAEVYASMPEGGRVIDYAMGPSMVHAAGYNAAADEEVVSYLKTVLGGVDPTGRPLT